MKSVHVLYTPDERISLEIKGLTLRRRLTNQRKPSFVDLQGEFIATVTAERRFFISKTEGKHEPSTKKPYKIYKTNRNS